jgi:hypothetical protein
MSRVNMEDFKLRGGRHGPGFYLDSINLAGAAVPSPLVLTPDMPPLLLLAPTGATNLRMPTSSLPLRGLTFFVVNSGSAAITPQTDGGAAFATALSIAAGQTGILICTGSTTQNLAWAGMSAAGTQTSP